VFEQLYEEIVKLEILPGARMSEVEVSKRFGVSRQPVRDAFKRLGSLELLEIRPQRATSVRLFSMQEIDNTRFLRLAVELELVELACENWDQRADDTLQKNLEAQSATLLTNESERLHQLDYEFHKQICDVGGRSMAFDAIQECKRKVDRLCILSLTHDAASAAVIEDHQDIIDAIRRQSVGDARECVRHHLGRLNNTIKEIYETHADFFV